MRTVRGRRSGKLNWPPCGGFIGGTPSDFTKHWITPPHRKWKPSTISPSPSTQGRKRSGTKPRTLHSPTLGAYNAQDPLGLAPRVASAQGYVDHAAHWVDVLGLHGREAHLEPKTIKSKDTGNFRGDSYTKLDTVGPEGTPIERHHLIGQHALKENGVSSRHTPSIMMDKADHALTRNHQKMAGHDAFRQVEKARVKEAAELAKNGDRSLYEDMLLDEAADIEKRIPGKYDVPLNEALDFYIANPEIAFPS